ncbi:MAG: 23S rRNA pseudouridine(1911/1915/1917) synthase RluD [Gammaproteobacteria bacterium]
MNETIEAHFVIEDAQAGRRLDQVLTELLSVHSRGRVQSWIEAGQVTVNGKVVAVKQRLWEGDKIDVAVVLAIETEDQGEDMPLNIVYADDSVIVINKPAGLVVHPGAGIREGTLMNALLYHYPELAHLPRAGIVHRLDKDTTGLMVIARTVEAHTALVEALQERNVKRTYLAITQGVLRSSGTVETNMGRHPKNRVKMAVLDEGKHAVTHYHILERLFAHTYVQCDLETGRTHQIRVHMAHLGYSLLGDPVYGPAQTRMKGLQPETIAAVQGFKRQALHATLLAFEHPETGEWVEFKAELPQDMAELLAILRKDNPHVPHHST